ncbi:MAG: ATP-binding protein [Methanoregula sp.]
MEESNQAGSAFRLYDSIPHGLFVLRPDFTVVFWNACIAGWTGIPADKARGMNILKEYPSLNTPSVISRITQLFEGGPAVLFSQMFHRHLIPCRLPNGALRVLKISCIPLDYAGEICALVVAEDITDLTSQVEAYRGMKNLTERQLDELKKVQESLFVANRKLNFLNSLIRHDILNQLTPLNISIDLARLDYHDPALIRVFDTVTRSSRNIQRQIEFTQVYQITGTRPAIWQNVAGTFLTAADSLNLRDIRLKTDLPDVEVFADPLLERVFLILLDNSLRHGEKISTIRCSGTRCNDGFLLVYRDDGVGVPADAKEKIFRREFFKYTGFGLFLAQEILGITNITIRENGIPGKGAQFEIIVPPDMYRLVTRE